jgi:16S rRNA (guanine527-N7)-methyltransferase
MTERTLTPADEFVKALRAKAPRFGVRLDEAPAARLRDYFEHVMAWNKRLHLVAPCPPAEFATRHVLESLLALPLLSRAARVVDVGSGAGLPVIPCLIARPALDATLFESSQKKAVFLREALRLLDRPERARVMAGRFENAEAPEADALTCRALDRFTELFPELNRWSARIKTLLLFGGDSLREEIERAALPYTPLLVPESERRFLFVVEREASSE